MKLSLKQHVFLIVCEIQNAVKNMTFYSVKFCVFKAKMFKYNPQNGLEATAFVFNFVSVSLFTVLEINIISHLLFLNQSNRT